MSSSSYKDFFDKAQKEAGVLKKNASKSVTKKSLSLSSSNGKRKIKSKIKFINNPLMFCFIVVGFVCTMAGGVYTDQMIRFFRSINISIFSSAFAEETSSTNAKSGGGSKSADAVAGKNEDPSKSGVDKNSENDTDETELNHLARLRERKNELDKKEEELAKLEEEIAQQRKEMEQKLKELEEVRKSISSKLEEKVQVDDQKIQDLVAFYSNMKPPQAAKIIETIDEALAVRIIEKMKKKNAADIMNLLKPEKAKTISEKYASYR